MSRSIDVDALMDALGIATECKDCSRKGSFGCKEDSAFVYACEAITDAPTIDAVPVVRCKDCMWYTIARLKKDGTDDRRCKRSYCILWGNYLKPDYFCADGEREEE